MHPLLEHLTAAQREAVQHVEGPLLVLAGPGSGKTRVITHRIAWLLKQGIPGSQIVALTFTNKAADEMRQRVEQLAPGHGVWLGTFHRFCAQALRKYAPLVGLRDNYTIYDTADSQQALRIAARRLKLSEMALSLDSVLHEISWAKNHLISPDEFDATRDAFGPTVKRLFAEYQRELLESNAVDFDDLLVSIANLLRDHPEVRARLDERCRFLMVDEYQDTNFAQYAIARALSIDHPNLGATGDPDQSIYGWRGANLNNILEFERDFPKVHIVRLERNYRSTQRILQVADFLIKHNVRRKQKQLYTHNDEGLPVRLVAYASEREEAESIAATIVAEVTAGRRRWRDFALFYRINALSRTIEMALRAAGVPYQLVHGTEFFQRKEIKDVLAYVQLLANPSNAVALLRVLNVPTRGIGKTTEARLSEFARERRISLLEAAGRVSEIATIKPRSAKPVREFAAVMDRLAAAATGPIEEIVGLVLSETGYQTALEQSHDPADAERLDNVKELLTVARQFDDRHPPEGALEAFLEEVSLVSETDDLEASADRVTLMTLHASKGLEYPVVFIVAIEQGLLPHERSNRDDAEREEERRLLFVGITRAQQALQLSFAKQRDFRGQRKWTVPSSFLMELPRTEMELVDVETVRLDPHAHEPGFGDGPDEYGPVVQRAVGAAPSASNRPTAGDRTVLPSLAGLRLTTAAQLAGAEPPAKATQADAFVVGMVVLHAQHGLGTILALSGEGAGRRATVEFGKTVRQKITLADGVLQPVGQPRH